MRSLTLTLVAICLLSGFYSLQGQTINFTYDAGGNMTQRSLQVMLGGRFGNLASDSTVIPPLNFKIFPNPTNTFLNIEGDLPEQVGAAQLSLINMSGQVLKRDVYTGDPKTINVEDLKSGVYLLEISYSKEKKTTYKIIVTN